MDSIIVLSRDLAAQGFYPAIDPLGSSSVLMDPLVVGEDHYALAERAREALARFKDLQDIISLLGVEELGCRGPADRQSCPAAPAFSQPAVHRDGSIYGREGQERETCRYRGRLPCNLGWRGRYMGRKFAVYGGHDRGRPGQGTGRRESGESGMRLRIVTPLAVIVDEPDIVALRAEDASGSFGILPRHAEFLTALAISVVSWLTQRDTTRHYCAVRHGVLAVTMDHDVEIATREAFLGDDLMTLEDRMAKRFAADIENERNDRAESARLQISAIRQIMRHLRPNARSTPGMAA